MLATRDLKRYRYEAVYAGDSVTPARALRGLEAAAALLLLVRVAAALLLPVAGTTAEGGRGVELYLFSACMRLGCSYVSTTDCSFQFGSEGLHEVFSRDGYSASMPMCGEYLTFAWAMTASLVLSSLATVASASGCAADPLAPQAADALAALLGLVAALAGMGYWYSAFAASTGSEFAFSAGTAVTITACALQFCARVVQASRGTGQARAAAGAFAAVVFIGGVCALNLVVPPNLCSYTPPDVLPQNYAPVRVEAASAAAAPSGPVRVAFVGDTSTSPFSTRILYRTLKRLGVDLLVHLGDFDYTFSAQAWDDLITSELGRDFPVMAAAGNHDTCVWPSYIAKISERWARSALRGACEGWPGVAHACAFRGLRVVQTAAGDFGRLPEAFGAAPLTDVFGALLGNASADDAGWTVCAWHRNQGPYRTGHRSDGAPPALYELCRAASAPSVAAHDHLYARTRPMRSFFPPEVAPATAPAAGGREVLRVAPDSGVHVVSGLGGRELSAALPDLERAPHWARIVDRDTLPRVTAAALVCSFYDTDERTAECDLVDISGYIADSFTMVR